MEKKNLLLVSGIMIVLVVAIFGIVSFSSGGKDADKNNNLDVFSGSDNPEIEFREETLKEDKNSSGSSNSPRPSDIKVLALENGEVYSGKSYGQTVSLDQITLLEETKEENIESEDKITKA